MHRNKTCIQLRNFEVGSPVLLFLSSVCVAVKHKKSSVKAKELKMKISKKKYLKQKYYPNIVHKSKWHLHKTLAKYQSSLKSRQTKWTEYLKNTRHMAHEIYCIGMAYHISSVCYNIPCKWKGKMTNISRLYRVLNIKLKASIEDVVPVLFCNNKRLINDTRHGRAKRYNCGDTWIFLLCICFWNPRYPNDMLSFLVTEMVAR